jgi:hypothetical protein
MDKQLAKNVLKVVDTPFAVSTIEEYADMEIQRCHKSLEGTSELLVMARLQGQISALRKFKKIRDQAVAIKEKELGGSKESDSTASTW